MTDNATAPAPVYPVELLDPDDARFTFGLLHDVVTAVAAHGYPPVTTGADLVRFQQALFTAIYRTETTR
jgi:hypothetical protein